MTKKKRIMLTLDDDMVAAAERLKKDVFYNESWSELYRCVLRKGLEVVEAGKGEK